MRPEPARRGETLRYVKLAAEILIVGALGALVFAVHDVGYLLSRPYWLDESWVADSIRAPIGSVPFVTSSTPIAWTLLLHYLPGAGGGQTGRLVPLLFCSLTAMAGYVLGAALKLTRLVAGILVGSAALLAPAMLVRDDLKQYTAEAFLSVMILGLTAWLENEWGPRRLVILCACISVGFAFAATDVFVGAAALGGLVVENGAAREWRRVVHVLLAGVATGGACAIIYLLAVKPNVIPSLKSYWNADYLYRNQGYGHIARIVYDRIEGLDRYMGFGHPVALGVPTAIGLAGLIVDRRYALALTLPGTVAINIVAALAHAYPFGDERTSTYWLIMPPVIMAVGVAYLAYWAARWSRLIPGGVLVCALLPWVWATHPYVRSHLLPYEDARAEVTYFNTRYRAGDVLILDEEANYQFAFYEHRLTPSYSHLSSAAVGFVPVYPNQKWIIGLRDRQPTSVDYSLSAAVSYIDAEPAATRGRIWIIRSHMNPAEGGAWSADLAGRSVLAGPGGADPILLYTPAPSDPTTAAVQRASTSPQRQ